MTCDDRKCPPCHWCVDRDCSHAEFIEQDAREEQERLNDLHQFQSEGEKAFGREGWRQ